MAAGNSGFWQAVKDGYRSGQAAAKPTETSNSRASILHESVADGAGTRVTIYDNGTFTIKRFLGGQTTPDQLKSIELDADSMRRKSVTGRGAAALMTGGFSLVASNNRGVVYLTLTGATSGVQTFTTQNPGDKLLSDLRSLKAAGESVIERSASARQHSPVSDKNLSQQLERLASLRRAGALTEDEFATAKARLLR